MSDKGVYCCCVFDGKYLGLMYWVRKVDGVMFVHLPGGFADYSLSRAVIFHPSR